MKNVNIITKKAKRDLLAEMNRNGYVELHGELEIFASKNGKVFHYDKGDNQVTIWAKHANMHLLTGESFSSHGTKRIFDSGSTGDATAHTATDIGEGTNKDGTLLSGQQYFSNNSNPDYNLNSTWTKIADGLTPSTAEGIGDASNQRDAMVHPFFPTKMLFGTGFEWSVWTGSANSVPEDYRTSYISDGWDESLFNNNIEVAENNYSNDFSGEGGDLIQKRSMNDIFTGAKTTPTVTDEAYGIAGAIKDGVYSDSDTQRYTNLADPGFTVQKTEERNGNEFLRRAWAGVGNPSFIYATRELRKFETGSEVALSYDSNIENKITFQVVMPEQTGAEAGIYYPYNGYILKEAGLFCDARMLLNNTTPTGATVAEAGELDLYKKMPHGLMYAKRYISPITKSHDVSITSRWTLYL